MAWTWNDAGTHARFTLPGNDDTGIYLYRYELGPATEQPTGRCGMSLVDRAERDRAERDRAERDESRRAMPPITVRRFAESETMGFIEPVFAALATDTWLFARLGREWRLASVWRLRLVCRAWTEPADDLLLRRSLELDAPIVRMNRSWLARYALPRWPERDRASVVRLVRLACDADDVALLHAVHARLRITDSDATLALVRGRDCAARRCLAEILHARPRRLRRARRA